MSDEKFLVIASDVIHRRIEPMISRETRPGEFVTVTDVTSGTTLLSVQGPASRELISRLTDSDLSDSLVPLLVSPARCTSVTPPRWRCASPTWVSLGYELHVPAEYGGGVYDDLMAAGADLGIRPVGLAAMTSLRLEKGYRDFGVDIDNTDSPLEAGLGFAVASDKPGGFVGQDALVKIRAEGTPRTRVVGLVVGAIRPSTCSGTSRSSATAAGSATSVPLPTATRSAAAVGLAQVSCADGVTAEWLAGGGFTVTTGTAARCRPGCRSRRSTIRSGCASSDR